MPARKGPPPTAFLWAPDHEWCRHTSQATLAQDREGEDEEDYDYADLLTGDATTESESCHSKEAAFSKSCVCIVVARFIVP